MQNCFLIRERVVIFALDFPTLVLQSGNHCSLNERSRAVFAEKCMADVKNLPKNLQI